jgi:hypothetical protein
MNYTYQSGETAELKGRERIVYTAPHLLRHPKGIHETELIWLEEGRMRVKR